MWDYFLTVLRYGCRRSSPVFIGQRQACQAFDEEDVTVEEIDEAADEHGRNDGADAEARQGPQSAIEERKDDGQRDHRRIKGHFRLAHAPLADLRDGFDGTVTGHHQDLRRRFDADAETQNSTAQDEEQYLQR